MVAGASRGHNDGTGPSYKSVGPAWAGHLGGRLWSGNRLALARGSMAPARDAGARHHFFLRHHFSLHPDQQTNLRRLFLQREFDLRDVVRLIDGRPGISKGARRQRSVARVTAGSVAVVPQVLARTFRRTDRRPNLEWRARSNDEELARDRLLQVRARVAHDRSCSQPAGQPADP